MKIILEGPDNVGKSSLIRGLQKELKYPFISMNSYAPPKFDDKDDLENFHKKVYQGMFDVFKRNEFVITDRFYPGAYVYSKLYKRNSDGNFVIDLEEQELKNKELEDIILIILIDTPLNLMKREDGLSIETGIEYKSKEVLLYQEFFIMSKVKNKFLIDVNGLSQEEVLKIVMDLVKNVHK